MNNNENWKSKLMLSGTLIGAAVGLITAIMLARTAEEEGGELNITTSDLLKTSLTIISTIRGVAALGGGK